MDLWQFIGHIISFVQSNGVSAFLIGIGGWLWRIATTRLNKTDVEVAELRKKVENLQTENAQLTGQVGVLEENIKVKSENFDELKSLFETSKLEWETQNAELRVQVAILQKENAALTNHITTLRTIIEDFNNLTKSRMPGQPSDGN